MKKKIAMHKRVEHTKGHANALRDYFRRIGSLGGVSGTGAAKRRTKSHYQRAAKARWEKENAKTKPN